MLKKFKNWLADKIDGHISIGNLTIYGDNAMHWGINFRTKKYGYVCFRLPIPSGIAYKLRFGERLWWRPLYFYISPNATPWAATFMLGKKHSPTDWALSRIRRLRLGLKYTTSDNEKHEELRRINNVL